MTTMTMAQAVWPRRTTSRAAAWGRDLALALAFSVLTALSAQIAIYLPRNPVPITGQTFAVLLTGALLGPRLAAASMLLYLTAGFAGLPVFAPGPATLAGFGYLVAFPFAAALVGALAERGWDRRPATMLAAMALGSFVIYLLGVGWLAHFFGLRGAITEGMLPFLPGDAVKALLSAGLLPMGWKWIGRHRA